MAHLIRPFINSSGFPSVQEMHRSTRHSFDFTPDAFSPFGYPKRVLNDFYLRDSFTFDDLFDEVGKRNGYFFVYRFFLETWMNLIPSVLPFL